MGFFRSSHALRAVLLACGMVSLGPAGTSVAGPAGIPYGLSPKINSDEPFGLYTRPVTSGVCLTNGLASLTSSRTNGCSLPFAMATASAVYQRPR
jgi:hypothetical protein